MKSDRDLLLDILSRLNRIETRLTRFLIHQGLNPYEKEEREEGINRENADSRIPLDPISLDEGK